MDKINLIVKCQWCGKDESVAVYPEDFEKFKVGVPVQDCMPYLHPLEKEVLISSTCLDCLSRTFNTPKPNEDWGKNMGECYNCGTPLWERNLQEDMSIIVCPTCGEEVSVG